MKIKFKCTLVYIALITLIISFLSTVTVSYNAYAESRYSANYGLIATYASSTTETISFTNREVSYIETVKGVPKYTQLADLSNSCGATGGAIIVGFYDKYYEDLIPNYSSAVSSGTYKGIDKVYIPQLMGELYTLMRTNVDDVGVSQSDCLNGLKQYIINKGHYLNYTSIISSKMINETSFTNAINNNNPSILFCSKMDMYTFSNGSTSDTIMRTTYTGAHIIVAYGLYTVNYYNGSSVFRTDKYLRVATGLSAISIGYIKIDSTDWCNDAYAVAVY